MGIILTPSGFILADDYETLQLAMDATPWSGVLALSPGKQYLVDNLTVKSGVIIKAYGAQLIHVGIGPLLLFNNVVRARLIGEPLLKAGPGTTDLIRFTGRKCKIEAELEGNNQALNGLNIIGRLGSGCYYNKFYLSVDRTVQNGIFFDGWDESRPDIPVACVNANDFYTPLLHSNNGIGLNVEAGENNRLYGGSIENNGSFAIRHGLHGRRMNYFGMWIENNNGGNCQFEMVDNPASLNSSTFNGTVALWPLPSQVRQYFKDNMVINNEI